MNRIPPSKKRLASKKEREEKVRALDPEKLSSLNLACNKCRGLGLDIMFVNSQREQGDLGNRAKASSLETEGEDLQRMECGPLGHIE